MKTLSEQSKEKGIAIRLQHKVKKMKSKSTPVIGVSRLSYFSGDRFIEKYTCMYTYWVNGNKIVKAKNFHIGDKRKDQDAFKIACAFRLCIEKLVSEGYAESIGKFNKEFTKAYKDQGKNEYPDSEIEWLNELLWEYGVHEPLDYRLLGIPSYHADYVNII